MVGVSYTFSKTLGTGTSDYSNMRIDGKDRQYNYGLTGSDQPHNFVANLVYQTPKVADGVAGLIANGWQISGVYRFASGYPYGIAYNFNGDAQNNAITGSEQGGRVVIVGDPGKGWTSDPYAQVNAAAFAPPKPGSIGTESSAFFLHQAPLSNLDLSLAKSFQLHGRAKFELRLDAFNALNHMSIFSTNNTIRFTSLTDSTIQNIGASAGNGRFGAIAGTWPQRQLQLLGRLTF
jgi:hypothetical protein